MRKKASATITKYLSTGIEKVSRNSTGEACFRARGGSYMQQWVWTDVWPIVPGPITTATPLRTSFLLYVTAAVGNGSSEVRRMRPRAK